MAYGDNRSEVASDGFGTNSYDELRTEVANDNFGTNTYGADRNEIASDLFGGTELASDTFDTSIDSNWDNGHGDWNTMNWVSGGYISKTNSASIYRNAETYEDDQYCEVVIESLSTGNDITWIQVRAQGGTDESSYAGIYETQSDEYQITEFDSSFGETNLANATNNGNALASGDTIRTEVIGTLIRFGTNEAGLGGGDTERLNASDATITSGSPAIGLLSNDDCSIDSWAGGDLVATGLFDTGFGDWDNMVGAYGGRARPENINENGLLRVVSGTYSDDQYSTLLVESLAAAAAMGAMVRMQPGATDESSYSGIVEIDTDLYLILQVDDGLGNNLVASAANSGADLVPGDTITLECEGTLFRLGTDEGSGDTERTSGSDATIASGRPGILTAAPTDTNDSSVTGWSGGDIGGISSDWENGGGDWGPFTWLPGGYIDAPNDDDGGLRRNLESFVNDQYSIVTVQNHTTNDDWVGAAVRMASGTDESCYICYYDTKDNDYSIWECNSVFFFSEIASTSNDTTALQAGDTVTAEIEGTTIRCGTNEGSGDAQRITTTDATITSGNPGIVTFEDLAGDIQFTAWSGGDIGGISSDWAIGEGDWGDVQWIAGGHIVPVSSFEDAAMRRNSESFADDQYSIVTIQTLTTGSDWIAANVRMQSGTDESAYVGYYENENDEYNITEFTAAFGQSTVASTANSGAALSPGDTITLECEGITLRMGTNEGAGDTERLNTSDATITSGDPGLDFYEQDTTEITAWSGGDIGGDSQTLDQFGFFNNDDVEADATPIAAQNVNITQAQGIDAILRQQINNVGDFPGQALKLQCKKTSDSDLTFATVRVAT